MSLTVNIFPKPHNTTWLSAEDRRLAQARLSEDAGEADKDNPEDSPLEGLKMAIKDPLVFLFALQTVSQLLGLSFVQYFPTYVDQIVRSTGL
ncbi:hypothetical protein H0H81_002695 [Sphagnurus paluster]|uniref:Uncharacterized protein n=1 Tax=Sphagnurus paluster TaxID=117069 RepID=A0A9P7FSB8_9AGAR|nr:hypothetical protein H0H81_002695 [Sphagnurus paluster]